MLCLYQYISIVKWSDEDHYHSLEITSILKEHAWCYIFPKDPVTSYDNVHHFCEKLGNTGVLPFTRWVQDWPRNSILTVLLGDLAANVMHGPMLLTLKTSTYNAYMNIHSHRTITSSPLSTLDLWVILNCVPTYFHSIPSTPTYSHPLPITPTHSHPLPLTPTYSNSLTPTPTYFHVFSTNCHSFLANSYQLYPHTPISSVYYVSIGFMP